MSKIGKLIKALSLVVRQPSLLNHVINADEVMRKEVAEKYNLPHGLKTIDILELFPDFHETITPFSGMEGSSTPLDLAVLKSFARRTADCNYLEIGTWRGESVANVAAVAKECITVNLPDEEMLQMGMDRKYVGMHRFFSKELINVKHIQANSSSFDFKSLDKKFDLIFVDGDHHCEQVKNDTTKMFELLRDDNSVIVWHDYAHHSGVIRFEVLAGIMAGCPVPFRENIYHISNTLLAVFIRDNPKATYPAPFSNPSKTFKIDIKANRI